MARIPLQIIEGRIILTSVIECASLRIAKQVIEFVVDTGSSESYISEKEVIKLQIPTSEKRSSGEVDFGGSRYSQIELPKITFYMLDEEKKPVRIEASFYALKTNKTSPYKIQAASALPSIIGTNFLKEQKLSLHVIMSEEIAFLERE